MSEESSNTLKIIKKYKNRRLYDLERSQYVTMEDLQNYVMQDLDFRVLDATSGKDLTNATLLQIFVELESHSTQALSPKVLRQLIKFSKHPMGEQYKTIFEEMLGKIQTHLQPYAQGMQATTGLWMKQSEQFMKSWQEWLQSRGNDVK